MYEFHCLPQTSTVTRYHQSQYSTNDDISVLTSSVTSEMARLQSLLDGIAVTNGASSSVDQPRTRLHLADEFFVEETTSLLVERAVLYQKVSMIIWIGICEKTYDGDDITLREHVFKLLHSSSLDSLGRLWNLQMS